MPATSLDREVRLRLPISTTTARVDLMLAIVQATCVPKRTPEPGALIWLADQDGHFALLDHPSGPEPRLRGR